MLWGEATESKPAKNREYPAIKKARHVALETTRGRKARSFQICRAQAPWRRRGGSAAGTPQSITTLRQKDGQSPAPATVTDVTEQPAKATGGWRAKQRCTCSLRSTVHTTTTTPLRSWLSSTCPTPPAKQYTDTRR